nr:amino-acid acetyltransferase, mitochondrial [Quercus suber]
MNVLNANATKRDAKQYLARFKPGNKDVDKTKISGAQKQVNAHLRKNQDRLERMGVNLGGLYSPGRAISECPQFIRDENPISMDLPATTIRVALVCLRQPQKLDDTTLDGLALTLSQLVKLDMRIALVLDVRETGTSTVHSAVALQRSYGVQAERICRAMTNHSPAGARVVDAALEATGETNKERSHRSSVRVGVPKLIDDPLQRSMIPVIPSFAYTTFGKLVVVEVGDVMEALTAHIGLEDIATSASLSNCPTAVDRIILLDQAGGIPSKDRNDGAHVFINIEQELESIVDELSEYQRASGTVGNYAQHQENLGVLARCLNILPSASSALITSPQEAASASRLQQQPTMGAGTRRQKNLLIHNLLTNKPMVSSSLPTARLSSTEGPQSRPTNAATLVKRGMPLTMIPSTNRGQGWAYPQTGLTSLDLEKDPRIDFARLLHLIDDSFRRKLDAQAYLKRIRGRTAGIIVAGDYEGGAILTWEQPQGSHNPARLVPYLDKFAVLQSSQGSSGVADIVFQAMVRSCFPHGVCWRSRKDNPVNKWYFERAAGSWQIPHTNWTMFWTGEGVVDDKERWEDYMQVCRDVQPTWLDTKKPD